MHRMSRHDRSGLSRREVLALSAAAVPGLLIGCRKEQKAPRATEGGAIAKNAKKQIVAVGGLDLHDVDPQEFKSLPGYFAVANIYDNLFSYAYTAEGGGLRPVADPATGQWELRPALAESWSVSDDRRTLTFRLRKDARFGDGSPVRARDVKATWDRIHHPGASYMDLVRDLLTIADDEQITTPDDYTVVVRLGKPESFALDLFATNILNIMSADALAQHASASDPRARTWFESHALGSGPYVLASWREGEQWELAPNPHYWNRNAVQNDGVIQRVVSDPKERLRLLLSGDADLAYNLGPDDLASLRSHPDIQLLDFSVPWPYYLGMNTEQPPFNDVRVRQAISHAIPYQRILNEVMHGFAKELRSPVAHGMPSSDYSFWHYDGGVARARELLAEAGVKHFEFDLAVLMGFAQHEPIANLIAEGVAAAGGRVRILPVKDESYYDRHVRGHLHAWIGEFYSWVNDPIYHLYWNFLSTNTHVNGTRYTNARVDEIITTGLFETDRARREALSREAQKIIVDEAPWALLFQMNYVVAARRNVRGYNWNPDIGARYWMVSKD
jgi:peptide/nickel transport system substrate-binding protein